MDSAAFYYSVSAASSSPCYQMQLYNMRRVDERSAQSSCKDDFCLKMLESVAVAGGPTSGGGL